MKAKRILAWLLCLMFIIGAAGIDSIAYAEEAQGTVSAGTEQVPAIFHLLMKPLTIRRPACRCRLIKPQRQPWP